MDFVNQSQGIEIEFLSKMEKFGRHLNADLILANTTNGKVYLIGVSKASSNVVGENTPQHIFYEQEIVFPGNKDILYITETKDMLILATEDKRLVLISNTLQPISVIDIGATITSLDTIDQDK